MILLLSSYFIQHCTYRYISWAEIEEISDSWEKFEGKNYLAFRSIISTKSKFVIWSAMPPLISWNFFLLISVTRSGIAMSECEFAKFNLDELFLSFMVYIFISLKVVPFKITTL